MFKIYRSSAGSGKTYTLVKEYLILSLIKKKNFKNILAITFTNKSTQELKDRILNQLHKFSNGDIDSMGKELMEISKWNEENIIKNSSILLSKIIYNYQYFAVKTIDSFFYDIIKSFSKELGIENEFTIETDINFVIETIIEKIFLEIETNKNLTNWLVKFSENKLLNGKKWFFNKELYLFIKQIFSEKFLLKENKILEYLNKEKIQKYVSLLNKNISFYENSLIKLSSEALKKIEENNLTISDFLYGQNGVAGYLKNLSNGIIKPMTSRAKSALEDSEKWSSKTSEKKHIINKLASEYLINILNQIADLEKIYFKSYNDALVIKPLIYTLGLTIHILHQLRNFRKESKSILISDIIVFLKKITKEESIPFIYEKMGNYYKYFLIDEFQDVSNLQWGNFLPLLDNTLSQGGKVVIVGDAKQSIYRWRGGTSNLLTKKVKEDLKVYNPSDIFLEKNWRSSSEIVSFNNEFFIKASETIYNKLKEEIGNLEDKQVTTDLLKELNKLYNAYHNLEQKAINENKSDCYLLNNYKKISIDDENTEKADLEDISIEKFEKDYIIKKIENIQENNSNLCDIAILVRNNNKAQEIVKKIDDYKKSIYANKKYNYETIVSSSFYLSNNIVIKIIINILKWISQNDDFFLFESSYLYNNLFLNEELELSDYLFENKYLQNIPKYFLDNINNIYNLNLYDGIEFIINSLNLRLKKNDIFIDPFLEIVYDFNNRQNSSINEFLKWWEIKGKILSIESNSNKKNAIKIMTIHQSKGLEFEAVIIPFCDWNLDHSVLNSPVIWTDSSKGHEFCPPIIPLYYFKNLTNSNFIKDYFIEKMNIYFDNLNLLYVAFTRAKKELHINLNCSKIGFKNVSDLIKEVNEKKNEPV